MAGSPTSTPIQVIEAQFLTAEGKVLGEHKPGRVIADLSKALQDRSEGTVTVAMTPLYVERGRAYLKTGQTERAEADFLLGIRAFNRLADGFGRTTPDLVLRSGSRSLRSYDCLADRRAPRPFSGAEAQTRSCQRAVRTSFQAEQPIVLLHLIWRISEGVCIQTSPSFTTCSSGCTADLVDYQRSDDKRQSDRQRCRPSEPSGDLSGDVAQDRDVRRSAATLYDALIRPIQNELRGFPTLLIVPDKLLYKVPFSALFDQETGRYLVEDHASAISPSLALLGEALDHPHAFRERLAGRALVVGNPAFDRTRLSNLPDLPGAEAEAEKIAKILPDSLLLTGKNATRKAFLDAANQYRSFTSAVMRSRMRNTRCFHSFSSLPLWG